MLNFASDYNEGAHPAVLSRLIETNLTQSPGYGEDEYCDAARALIKGACRREDALVQFVVGGTQANLLVISSILRPHQGVLCAETGHINVHESGAVEATGHKVLSLPSADGKITATQVRDAYAAHWNDATHEHMVQPGMVYISHPSEVGTLYTKAELTALSVACRELGLPLFLDGARLGYGLAAPQSDVTLPDVAALCDVFYIGGTKVGALFGEAIVIPNPAYQKDFRYLIKQKGAMLAKGRLLGLQFEALFTGGLYLKMGRHAVTQALRIRDAFVKKGFAMLIESPTNQQFPILPDAALRTLGEKYVYTYWCRVDEAHSAVRFCTSWATQLTQVDALAADIAQL